MGAFYSRKIADENFWNSTCQMERYNPVAQTRPKPARVWLFAVERYWEQQFCRMDRDISVLSTEMSGSVKVDHL